MAEVIIPCYGGPYDGKFYSEARPPIGYKEFEVKRSKRRVYLWKSIKVEYLDFQTLARASKLKPDEEPDTTFGEGL